MDAPNEDRRRFQLEERKAGSQWHSLGPYHAFSDHQAAKSDLHLRVLPNHGAVRIHEMATDRVMDMRGDTGFDTELAFHRSQALTRRDELKESLAEIETAETKSGRMMTILRLEIAGAEAVIKAIDGIAHPTAHP